MVDSCFVEPGLTSFSLKKCMLQPSGTRVKFELLNFGTGHFPPCLPTVGLLTIALSLADSSDDAGRVRLACGCDSWLHCWRS